MRSVRAGSAVWMESGRPVDIPRDETTAGAQGAVQLGERRWNVGHVLEYLHRQRGVEARVLDRQRGGVCLMERDVFVSPAAMRRYGEHRLAVVNPDRRALRPDLLEQFGDVEAGSAAHVQDAFAGRDTEGVADQLPTARHIPRPVERVERPRDALVEFQLAHLLIAPPWLQEPRAAVPGCRVFGAARVRPRTGTGCGRRARRDRHVVSKADDQADT